MASNNSQGIQTLLEAEKEASKIVEKARQYRVQRLKDARSEAAKEIENLKQKKNNEFQEFEKQHAGNTDDIVKAIQNETQAKLEEVRNSFNSNKEKVQSTLIETVLNVKPEPHRNSKFTTEA